MTGSVDKLYRESANDSDQMEFAAQKLFGHHLAANGWDCWDVALEVGKVQKGKGAAIAQSGCIFGAQTVNEVRLYLVETRRFPHINGVRREDDDITSGVPGKSMRDV